MQMGPNTTPWYSLSIFLYLFIAFYNGVPHGLQMELVRRSDCHRIVCKYSIAYYLWTVNALQKTGPKKVAKNGTKKGIHTNDRYS